MYVAVVKQKTKKRWHTPFTVFFDLMFFFFHLSVFLIKKCILATDVSPYLIKFKRILSDLA